MRVLKRPHKIHFTVHKTVWNFHAAINKKRDRLGNTIQGIFAMQQLIGHKFQHQGVKQWLVYEPLLKNRCTMRINHRYIEQMPLADQTVSHHHSGVGNESVHNPPITVTTKHEALKKNTLQHYVFVVFVLMWKVPYEYLKDCCSQKWLITKLCFFFIENLTWIL